MIIGGVPPKPYELAQKYTVAIRNLSHDTLCTGTIVGRRLVVTAAHCLSESDVIFVAFGDNAVSPQELRTTESIAIFSGSHVSERSLIPGLKDMGDVAAITLKEDIPATHRVAKVVPKDKILKKNDRLMIVGFGTSEGEARTKSGILRKTHVNVLMERFGKSEFVVDQTAGTGACFGDSGGPAFLYENAEYLLVGIASRVGNLFFDKCEGLAIYSHAGYYREFIFGQKSK